MSLPPFAEERRNVPGWVPPLTEEDKNLADKIVKDNLGDQASGDGFGVYARGVQGDAAFCGEAVVITDPEIIRHADDWGSYLNKLGQTAQTIGNSIANAGNVVIDITPFAKRDSAEGS